RSDGACTWSSIARPSRGSSVSAATEVLSVLVGLSVAALTLDPRDGRAVLLLVHAPSERVFPLWLDERDAAALARAAHGRHTSPPDPQDLGAALLDVTGARVEHAALLG